MKKSTELPPKIIKIIKLIGINFRYRVQLLKSRFNYLIFGNSYQQNILFIAGLPKSGTTWLKRMLITYEGFIDILIPEVTYYELSTGGSHNFDLPLNSFSRFKRNLVISKMHIHGSSHNIKLLDDTSIKYVVLYRDLRDVAISYYYYVRKTIWHPQYQIYSNLSLREGLELFGATLLEEYRDWIITWEKNINPQSGLMIRYEDLLTEPIKIMKQITEHFSLDSSQELLNHIVEENSFFKLSQGRNRGESDPSSFYRKGTIGDWQNHFTPETKSQYKKIIGQFLIEYGYERDKDW